MLEDVTRFGTKADARQWAWDALDEGRLARFPFPPHGRIPNFAGAAQAAVRVFAEAPWSEARAIKINPDSPQLPVRLMALQRGIAVYVPTPKLAAGFNLLDPARIPSQRFREAATLKTMLRWAQPVALEDLPQLDAIVTGCAAVTASGKRAGKGAGYSDLEFAILRELGLDPVPVATTVHDVQVVEDFPIVENDLPLSLICTPTRTIRVQAPPAAPEGIRWDALSAEQLASMPVLESLRRLKRGE